MSNGSTTSLAGAWAKSRAPSCADKYPDTLTFAAGTYRGTRGTTPGLRLLGRRNIPTGGRPHPGAHHRNR
jgi:nicotinate-nucleotide pyrophosphorylase